MKHGSKLFIGVLALLYVLFLMWFNSSEHPVSVEEAESRLVKISESSLNAGGKVPEIGPDELHAFFAGDDGREFFMVNLIKYRDKALYPQELKQEMGDDPMLANDRYGRAIMPYLIKNGSVPIYMSNVSGRFIHTDGATDWDAVGIVRYRSRRDFLNMIEQISQSTSSIMVHKWASVERTQVFPTTSVPPLNNSNFIRIVVLSILVAFATVSIFFARVIRHLASRRNTK